MRVPPPRRPLSPHRFLALTREMYDDPELTGDVLHLGLALAESLTRTEGNKGWLAAIGERVGGNPQWVRWALSKDLPRHEPIQSPLYNDPCIGEMIRRPGLCGKRSTQRHWQHDPLTGVVTVVGSCNRHHDQVEAVSRRLTYEWIAAGKRPGPQNAGGILERYFNGNWEAIYKWARPSWVRPGTALEPPRRPSLTLIRGGLDLLSEESP